MSVLDPWFQPALFWRYSSAIALGMLSLWWPMWSIRHRRHLDLPTDEATRLVRWVVIATSWILGSLPVKGAGWLRLPFGVTAVAFHSWPNLSVHLVRWWRKRGSSRDADGAA